MKKMHKYIDANIMREMIVYDDEHEECGTEKDTIENLLDKFTNEGCPDATDVVKVVRCRDCIRLGEPTCLMAYGGKEWAEEDGFCHAGEREAEEEE